MTPDKKKLIVKTVSTILDIIEEIAPTPAEDEDKEEESEIGDSQPSGNDGWMYAWGCVHTGHGLVISNVFWLCANDKPDTKGRYIRICNLDFVKGEGYIYVK
jgi:hypothetical protein